MSDLQAQLDEARETNRRLNRRAQKAERRINRWYSGRYTRAFYRDFASWRYKEEASKNAKLEKELNQYKSPSVLIRVLRAIIG